MAFDYPNTTTVTDVPEFIEYANYLSDGYVGIMILIVVGFVAYFTTKTFAYDKSLGFAGFITLIVAIFLRLLNWINDSILQIVIILFVGVVIMLMWARGKDETT